MFLLQNKVCNVVIHFAAGSRPKRQKNSGDSKRPLLMSSPQTYTLLI